MPDFAAKFSHENVLVLVCFQAESSAVINGREAEDIRFGTAKGLGVFKKEAALT